MTGPVHACETSTRANECTYVNYACGRRESGGGANDRKMRQLQSWEVRHEIRMDDRKTYNEYDI